MDNSTASFATGLAILFFAQLLSAIMGIYVQEIYAKYGPHWHENLFYSHLLSLPLFAPFFPSLWTQFNRLVNSPSFTLVMPNPSISSMNMSQSDSKWSDFLTTVSASKPEPLFSLSIPFHILMLLVNSLTQFACIRGVNLLGARTSALGVTVVLNLRKLVSLFASIWLFGNQLPIGVIAGAAIVFSGAAVYSWGGPKPKKQTQASGANGKAKTG
ncbi:MAG: golgi uridine diphosphate-N- acetylglucosamine transporter [Stictis urceolatum]|nr:golgi uridine diphosphate-N- acetylglucosamine transporter [Stictis urceolata]